MDTPFTPPGLPFGFGPAAFGPTGFDRRHGRREFRDHVRAQAAGQQGPFGPGFGRGFGPGFGPGFGFGPGGPRGRGGRGPRGRGKRGDVRAAILTLLTERPMHGYEMTQEIAARSNDLWKPSPGSVYPTLQLLEEAGFASSSQHDGKRVYAITEAGQAELLAKMAQADGPPPWMDAESASGHDDLRKAVGQLVMAAKQVGMTDNQTHIETAAGVINEARRKLYQLLAEA